MIRTETAEAGINWWALCDNVVFDVMSDLTALEAGCGEGGKGLKQRAIRGWRSNIAETICLFAR